MASCDTNIVVASTEVKLGVDLCAAKLVEEVGDKWNWVPILSSALVEVLEVNTEFQGATLFLGKRTGAPAGDWDHQMNPFPSISLRNSQKRPSSVPESR